MKPYLIALAFAVALLMYGSVARADTGPPQPQYPYTVMVGPLRSAEWEECSFRPDTVYVCTVASAGRIYTVKVWNVGNHVYIAIKREHVPRPDPYRPHR